MISFANCKSVYKTIIEKEKFKRKSVYDKNIKPQNFNIGNLVMIPINEWHKLDPPFKWPFEIIDIKEPNVTVKCGVSKNKILHNDKVKQIDSCFHYKYYWKKKIKMNLIKNKYILLNTNLYQYIDHKWI